MEFLLFLLLFVVLCGWLDRWATRTPKPVSKEGR
ncbi:hypothetical protein HD596_008068 [Nonomuraea jabiensis]|uniref:Uncharacterized protein n=1 Tax=Nonomuraea jabiensis TaxID=882448 RepID=A0A7W9GCK6_9ACTN|nr:hypothetical protein [Nonomuraea jabiensis]